MPRQPPENQRFGTWLLHVPANAQVQVAVYFRDPPEHGTAVIDLNGSEFESNVVDDNWYVFSDVALEQGDLDLSSHLEHDDGRAVAWQVRITRKSRRRESERQPGS
ncbi:MAG: hypothetical protein IH945_03840 [Armatimonadetes bacterium]|nr:hypothetical protein [Armatimonadota bacterium]